MDEKKITELLKLKWKYENENIRAYQKIAELKRKRLTNIKSLDMVENDLRKEFEFSKVRRKEIR
jgi:hypothetical protein